MADSAASRLTAAAGYSDRAPRGWADTVDNENHVGAGGREFVDEFAWHVAQIHAASNANAFDGVAPTAQNDHDFGIIRDTFGTGEEADPSHTDSNQGIVNLRLEPYAPLLQAMHELNRQVHARAGYFDRRKPWPRLPECASPFKLNPTQRTPL